MKKQKIFSFFVGSLCTLSLAAQDPVASIEMVDIDRSMPLDAMSSNGRYYVGNELPESFFYDSQTQEITYLSEVADEQTGAMWNGIYLSAVSNDGTACGSYGEGIDSSPALWKAGEWTILPVSENYDSRGSCNAITPDRKLIGGYVLSIPGRGIMYEPCIWKKSGDNYEFEALPYPEKDWNGLAPQYVVVMSMSIDGNILMGRIMDNTGFFGLPVVWTKDVSGDYSYKVYGEDIVFKKDAERPGPLPEEEDYITVPPTDPEYNQQAQAFNDALDRYFRLKEECITGATIMSSSIRLSENGRYITTTLEEVDGENTKRCPLRFDLNDETYKTFPELAEGLGRFTTNDGITFASSPYADLIRDVYVFTEGSDKPLAFQDWLAENYGLDITPELTYDYQLADGEWVYGRIITGTCIGNGEGGVIASAFPSPVDFMMVNYIVRIPQRTTAIKSVEESPCTEVYVKGGYLHISAETEHLAIYDVTGKAVYDNHSVKAVNLKSFPHGIYMVRLMNQGKTEVHKISY